MYLCPEDESTECSSPVRSSSMDEGRGESLSQSTHPSTHHRTSGSKSFAENVDPQSSPGGSTSSLITGLTGSPMRGTGSPMRGTGSPMRGTGSPMGGTGSPMGGRRKSSRQRKPTAVIREAAAMGGMMGGVKRKIRMDPDSEDEDEQLKYAFITDDDDLGPMGGSGKSAIFQEAASLACPGNGLATGNTLGTGNTPASSSTGQLSSNGFRPGSSTSNAEFNPSSVTDDHSYTANSSAFDSSPGTGGNNHSHPPVIGSSLPFINVEPPLSEEDYNFALEASEGIADLFDDDILI